MKVTLKITRKNDDQFDIMLDSGGYKTMEENLIAGSVLFCIIHNQKHIQENANIAIKNYRKAKEQK